MTDIQDPIPAETDRIASQIVDAVYAVHSTLGPGLLESAYEACLARAMAKRGLTFKSQVDLPVLYDGIRLDVGYRLDFLVEDVVVVEIKAVDDLLPIHRAQLLTYLKLSGRRLGLLVNFNTVLIKNGIKRLAL